MLRSNIATRAVRSVLALLFIITTIYYFVPRSTYAGVKHLAQPTGLSHSTDPPSGEQRLRLCKGHGFDVYEQGPRPRKVYDMFLISAELDWLEIRLNSLAPYVDHFIIVESSTTFTGLEKRLFLRENWDRFSEFHDKIIYREFHDPGPSLGQTTWIHESAMRNALFDLAFPSLDGSDAEPQLGDALLVSDVDEIPKPEALLTLRHCDFPARLTLRSALYYYSFQWLHRGEQWDHPQATTYQGDATISPQDLRDGDGGPGFLPFRPWLRHWQKADLWNAAWHCSTCFSTLAEVLAKMQSFSHTPLNTEENRDPNTIIHRVRNGLDLFGRTGEHYDRVSRNFDVPQYILEDKNRFRYLIDRDGLNAAFTDAQ